MLKGSLNEKSFSSQRKVAETQKNIKETTTLSQQNTENHQINRNFFPTKHRKISKKSQHSLKEKVAKLRKSSKKKGNKNTENYQKCHQNKKVINMFCKNLCILKT